MYHLISPPRKELHEVQDDIQRLIKGECHEITIVTQTLAYSIIGLLCLDTEAIVSCMGMSANHGMVYSVVLIKGDV